MAEVEDKEKEKELRMRIVRRAAQELQPGMMVNLGVGIPTLIADALGYQSDIYLHSENGVLGFGPVPPGGNGDPDLVSAGKRPVSELMGACYFDSSLSFAMVRGGHLDVSVLGALQVDEEGTIANWMVPGGTQLGVGGAMDMVTGAKQVIVTTFLQDRGRAKLLQRCTLPISGYHKVSTVITEQAVFRFRNRKLYLSELWPGVTVEDIRRQVEARFEVDADLAEMTV